MKGDVVIVEEKGPSRARRLCPCYFRVCRGRVLLHHLARAVTLSMDRKPALALPQAGGLTPFPLPLKMHLSVMRSPFQPPCILNLTSDAVVLYQWVSKPAKAAR